MSHPEELVLRSLRVQSGPAVLAHDVSLVARAGQITAVVGPSGVGKSVTARACLGVVDVVPGIVAGSLVYPSHSDRDWFAGLAEHGAAGMARLRERLAPLRGTHVSYAPQGASSALNPARTVGRQLALAFERGGTLPSAAQVHQLLDEVGLPARTAFAMPRELSGGMAQRVAIAVALAGNPRVLIADEPETGLDPIVRRQVLDCIAATTAERSTAVVLITHLPQTVERYAHVVVELGGDHA